MLPKLMQLCAITGSRPSSIQPPAEDDEQAEVRLTPDVDIQYSVLLLLLLCALRVRVRVHVCAMHVCEHMRVVYGHCPIAIRAGVLACV